MNNNDPGLYNQKCSKLLGKDENDSVLQLLGPKCQSLSMAVVQFFSTDGPEGTEWCQKNFGILSFVKDRNRKSYYFQLYCPIRHQLLWEHEMYNGFHYQTPAKFFHCFEAEECIVGFNFASEEEAIMLEETIVNLQRRREKRLEKKLQNKQNKQNSVLQTSVPKSSPVQFNGKRHKNKNETSKKKKLSKDQIGLPENFTHVQHIGWNKDRGFDLGQIKDPQLKRFFGKAGVSESHLQNPQTREFIYDFINGHGGMDAIKEAVQDSPVPDDIIIPPPPPPPEQIELPVETVPDTNTDREASLKPINPVIDCNVDVTDSNSTLPNSRSNLLDQIRQGVELKSVQPIQKKSVNNFEGDGLAGALARALADRARVIHSDSSNSDSSEDGGDDWDD